VLEVALPAPPLADPDAASTAEVVVVADRGIAALGLVSGLLLGAAAMAFGLLVEAFRHGPLAAR
jgi:hypothetical protein